MQLHRTTVLNMARKIAGGVIPNSQLLHNIYDIMFSVVLLYWATR